MELTAAGTPFVYLPLKNDFEQNLHLPIGSMLGHCVRATAGFRPADAHKATLAARMLADLL